MNYTVITAAEKPEHKKIHDEITYQIWPEFILHDPISNANFKNLYKTFAEYQISILINNNIVGFANCIPFYWDEDLDNLPEEGWDWALLKGFEDNSNNKKPNILCGLQIGIDKKYQGKGLSYLIVKEIKYIANNKGFKSLVIPVRPNLKSKYPLIPIENYIEWKDSNGLPFDAWLRVHAKLGARIIKVCHKAMYISGKIDDWQEWTNMKFPSSGDYVIDGALVPIKVDIKNNIAEYIEPNVWVSYELE
ncbi:GNAT family N-acetyltransferase [Thermoanaerobacterium thermosaccharolyticum]|uniref:GNAT family N-acetyltransferase n=1 Tax=Thermoanaerobacterium thermosaccharolyticum TaxID=1517 RepID=UPI003DA7F220